MEVAHERINSAPRSWKAFLATSQSIQAPQYAHSAHVRELELLVHTCIRLLATTRTMSKSTKAIALMVMHVGACATSTVYAMQVEQQGHGRVAWELAPRRMLPGGGKGRLLMNVRSASGKAKRHDKAFDIVRRRLPGGGRGAKEAKQSKTRD